MIADELNPVLSILNVPFKRLITVCEDNSYVQGTNVLNSLHHHVDVRFICDLRAWSLLEDKEAEVDWLSLCL